MITIEIHEETATREEMSFVLERIVELLRQGSVMGHEPSWQTSGEEEEEGDDSEDEETADELIEEGKAMLDALAEELEGMTDASAQRQTLNNTLDGWLKENSVKLDALSMAQRDRVESELADHCGSLHMEN